MHTICRFTLTALLAFSAVACSSSDDAEKKVDTVVATTTVAAANPHFPRPGEEGCPIDGVWRVCSLVERMERSGVAPKLTFDTLHVEWMSVPGIRISIGRSAVLTAFVYSNNDAAAVAVSAIDTVAVAPKGQPASVWKQTPNFVRNGNLVAVLESENARQIERVTRAILGGAP